MRGLLEENRGDVMPLDELYDESLILEDGSIADLAYDDEAASEDGGEEADPETLLLAMLAVADHAESDEEAQAAIAHIAASLGGGEEEEQQQQAAPVEQKLMALRNRLKKKLLYEMMDSPGLSMPSEADRTAKSKLLQLRARLKGDFREQDHPRDDSGRFGEGGGGKSEEGGSIAGRIAADKTSAGHVDALLEKHGAEHERLQKQLRTAGNALVEAAAAHEKATAPEEVAQAGKARKQAQDDFADAKGAIETHKNLARADLLKTAAVEKPIELVVARTSNWSKKDEQGIDRAAVFVRTLTASAAPLVVAAKKTSTGRASYDQGTVKLVSPRDDEATTVHELAHAVEERVAGATEAAVSFWSARTKGEKPVSLSEAFPDRGYGKDEYGRADDFGMAFGDDDLYVGKVYGGSPDGTTVPPKNTEILSMGLEKLYRDPIAFMKADPEYARFVLGALSGRVRQ